MTDQSPFQPRPQTTLSRDDVVNYLVEHKHRGYQIFQAAGKNGAYELLLDDLHRININMSTSGKAQVQGYKLNDIVNFYDVSSMSELRQAVDALAQRFIGTKWQRSPDTARLREDTPATNLATISNLIGTSSVNAIFDPYLENRSLASLIDILSFGAGSVATGVRVLSTGKTTSGKIPRLTKAGFDAWLGQLKLTGEIRIMGHSEHRRFMLLSGSQSLLLGQSLNSIHKNEAIRLEPDTHDKTFFDQVWSTAKPLT